MTITTDQTNTGCIDGMAKGAGASGINIPAGNTNVFQDDPTDVITAQTGSDIAFDTASQNYWMALGQGGSTWVRLGSLT